MRKRTIISGILVASILLAVWVLWRPLQSHRQPTPPSPELTCHQAAQAAAPAVREIHANLRNNTPPQTVGREPGIYLRAGAIHPVSPRIRIRPPPLTPALPRAFRGWCSLTAPSTRMAAGAGRGRRNHPRLSAAPRCYAKSPQPPGILGLRCRTFSGPASTCPSIKCNRCSRPWPANSRNCPCR